mmetsp:Transcript_38487/g.92162  ORF Transcript_38487/g.92162 Transcript_38487/m.92162 type:complete len:281 (-) Transcript_38487:214-1056(-)
MLHRRVRQDVCHDTRDSARGHGAADCQHRQGGDHRNLKRENVDSGQRQPRRVEVQPVDERRGEHPAPPHAPQPLRPHLPHPRRAQRRARPPAGPAPRRPLLRDPQRRRAAARPRPPPGLHRLRPREHPPGAQRPRRPGADVGVHRDEAGRGHGRERAGADHHRHAPAARVAHPTLGEPGPDEVQPPRDEEGRLRGRPAHEGRDAAGRDGPEDWPDRHGHDRHGPEQGRAGEAGGPDVQRAGAPRREEGQSARRGRRQKAAVGGHERADRAGGHCGGSAHS